MHGRSGLVASTTEPGGHGTQTVRFAEGLESNDVQKSHFLGPAFDPTSAERGPGNAVNLLLARPEIRKIVIDRSRMEVTYYSEKK